MKWLALITLMLPLVALAAEPLGRLFYTPQQRAALDAARHQKTKVEIEPESPSLPETISVNGVVKRSDGESTVWINNRPLTDKRAPNGIKIINRNAENASVTLKVPQSSRNVDVKVGQNLDATSGQIQESYQLPPQPVIRKKTISSVQSLQQSELAATPANENPKPTVSPMEAGDEIVSEPPQTDEQSAKPSTQ